MSVGVNGSLPRLLAGLPDKGYLSLLHHQEVYGDPLPRFGRANPDLLASIAEAGLRGRGGASFPTAIKLRAVASASGPAFVVANGAEGEPGSAKDRVLLEALPHLVLEGAAVAADVAGASEILVAVTERGLAVETTERAMAERHAARLREAPMRLVPVPNRYIVGEESALVHYLDGGPAKPRFVPPRPYERGVGGRPTLVQNVETLAHLALVARHGAEWFRQVGVPEDPGSLLITLGGAVAHPAVYEVEHGIRLGELLRLAGSATEPIRAFLIGGYFGTWVPREAVDTPLTEQDLAGLGAALGSGVVMVLPTSACPVAEVARVSAYLAEQSARQCGPCLHGLASIAQAVGALASGRPWRGSQLQLLRWLGDVEGRGACHHPNGAVRFIASALDVFPEEFNHHARRGRCDRCAGRAWLPITGSAQPV